MVYNSICSLPLNCFWWSWWCLLLFNDIISKESEVKKYQTQKFKFKRLEDKIIFGSEKNYFKDIVLDKKFRNFDETFIFTDELISHDLKYKDGLIIITSTTLNDVLVINGECSTF